MILLVGLLGCDPTTVPVGRYASPCRLAEPVTPISGSRRLRRLARSTSVSQLR